MNGGLSGCRESIDGLSSLCMKAQWCLVRITSQTISQASVFFSIILIRLAIVIKSSLLVNQNFPNKDIGFTVARCTKELEKIMTLELWSHYY
jgi:hypothetical protein